MTSLPDDGQAIVKRWVGLPMFVSLILMSVGILLYRTYSVLVLYSLAILVSVVLTTNITYARFLTPKDLRSVRIGVLTLWHYTGDDSRSIPRAMIGLGGVLLGLLGLLLPTLIQEFSGDWLDVVGLALSIAGSVFVTFLYIVWLHKRFWRERYLDAHRSTQSFVRNFVRWHWLVLMFILLCWVLGGFMVQTV